MRLLSGFINVLSTETSGGPLEMTSGDCEKRPGLEGGTAWSRVEGGLTREAEGDFMAAMADPWGSGRRRGWCDRLRLTEARAAAAACCGRLATTLTDEAKTAAAAAAAVGASGDEGDDDDDDDGDDNDDGRMAMVNDDGGEERLAVTRWCDEIRFSRAGAGRRYRQLKLSP